MNKDEQYMQRCLSLALLGKGQVSPNPMVGAILVYKEKIIGEGYHEHYGKAHAEVNCIANVAKKNLQYISQATLYVSLEPCSHYGKTPPCVDLILKHQIKKVIIGTKDIFGQVNGEGIAKLKSSGVKVQVGICEKNCIDLNKRFFTFHEKKRPFIILKWAQTNDGYIGNKTSERLMISNEVTNRVVHQWRSEEAGILIGTKTALNDNPSLTVRYNKSKNPVRLFIDEHLNVNEDFNIYNKEAKTIIFNGQKEDFKHQHLYKKIDFAQRIEEQILDFCFQNNIQSIIVEGGAKTLQGFIDKRLWDECRVITNTVLTVKDGIAAPKLSNEKLIKTINLLTDTIQYYEREETA